jgi:DNA-binding transcriptional LysR family regulator
VGVRARRQSGARRPDGAASCRHRRGERPRGHAAVAGTGIIYIFEDWLRPYFKSGVLEPELEPWWLRFSGMFLYYPGRRLVPAPLRAFIDFVKASADRD